MYHRAAHICSFFGRMWCRADFPAAVRSPPNLSLVQSELSFYLWTLLTASSAVCRAFQGIGGSSIYAVAMVMLYELVRPDQYPLYTVVVTAVVALAFALGVLEMGFPD
jgi:MFS family permease